MWMSKLQPSQRTASCAVRGGGHSSYDESRKGRITAGARQAFDNPPLAILPPVLCLSLGFSGKLGAVAGNRIARCGV